MVRIPSSVHVRLGQGLDIRKELLEAALKTAQLIQKFKTYQIENAEKKKLILKFKKQIADFKNKIHDLEIKDLPHNVVRRVEQEIQEPIPQPEEEFVHLPTPETEEGVIEQEEQTQKTQLERELEILKSKIDNIKI